MITTAQAASVTQPSLLGEIERVRTLLVAHRCQGASNRVLRATPIASEDGPASSALDHLCRVLNLSAFERDSLLACAGMELHPEFLTACHNDNESCASCQQGRDRSRFTFALALAALPEAHWDAVSPAGPLRFWRLVELGEGETVNASPLRLDESILHFLMGRPYLDERLRCLVEAVPASSLPGSQQTVAAQAAAAWWQRTAEQEPGQRPVRLQLWGQSAATRRRVAAAAAARQGYSLYRLLPQAMQEAPAEVEALARLLDRESALSGAAWMLELDGEPRTQESGKRLMDRLRAPLLLSSPERAAFGTEVLAFEIARPLVEEQRAAWCELLGLDPAEITPETREVDRLVAQYGLDLDGIAAVAMRAGNSFDQPGTALPALWESCRIHARTGMEGLAQRVEPTVTLDDLVLPSAQREALNEIVAQVRGRSQVLGSWGFAGQSKRGLGLTALFSGPSGTGKTMAAEALTNELGLDLYRIDLSQAVSKYIGETEKNLGRIFDGAELGGSILFFDEADALFGKRSEVRDSHDRYANIEVSYLLQRIECHGGLVVLATNMKAALDQAFLRRIRFMVNFIFPDASLREELWRKAFPRQTPVEGLDPAKLACLSVAGGSVRSIALNAAFLACHAGEPVRMSHVLRAARQEYAKLEKPMIDAEIRGWL